MAKKNLSSIMGNLMGNENTSDLAEKSEIKRSVGRPRKENKSDDVRTTLLCDKELLRKLKYIAIMEDKLLKDIINTSFRNYILQWESEHKQINLP